MIPTFPLELTRHHPQPSVCQWLENADDEQLYLSVVSLGEILKGNTVLPASKLKGSPLKVADGFIAATALEHDLTVVTRNVRDFEGLGVEVFNPSD